jgi:hypothetical protein
MPILRNARHEAFARALVRGASATAAYIAAGYSGNGAGQSASALLKNSNVAVRVAELKMLSARGAIMGATEVLAGLSDLARTCPDDRVRRQALVDLGRHYGLFDKSNVDDEAGEPTDDEAGAPTPWDLLLRAKPYS